jgi:hypothetical protein
MTALSRLTNPQIVVLALWRLGGATRRRATEDVAVEAWKIAPDRFSWQLYKEFPNLDTARVALSDAKKVKYGGLVEGDNRVGWLLNASGLIWSEEHASKEDIGAASSQLRREDIQALESVRQHAFYVDWQKGKRKADAVKAADALDLPADAPRRTIVRRAEALLNAARLSRDGEMEEFLRWLLTGLDS